jgi:hypothetical protein
VSVDAIMAAVLDAAERALDGYGPTLVADVRASISTPGGPGHRSAPGNPPHRESGDLYAKIGYAVTRGPGDHVSLEATAWSDHADPLERGTVRMAARPFGAPAERRNAPRVRAILAAAVAAARPRVP